LITEYYRPIVNKAKKPIFSGMSLKIADF